MHDEIRPGDGSALHRIGSVSRLAGVPVTTLRVWETRYRAFTPAKTEGRHRLYTDADVMKARLLRQLAGSGHSIGGIAHLPLQQLQLLAAQSSQAGQARPADLLQPVTAVVVGAALAARLQAPAWSGHLSGAPLQVRAAFVDLQEAAAPADVGEGGIDLLLVRLNTLQRGSEAQLAAALARLAPQRVILLYNFGPQAVVDRLRATGILVRREPVPDAELAELVRSVVLVGREKAPDGFGAGALIPRRRYSDATLALVAASPNRVVCECPRHIAELIGQLASFEQYSEECLNDSAEDASLHAYLRSVAGTTRALFEHALQLAARHGGLALTEDGGFVAAPQHDAGVAGAQ